MLSSESSANIARWADSSWAGGNKGVALSGADASLGGRLAQNKVVKIQPEINIDEINTYVMDKHRITWTSPLKLWTALVMEPPSFEILIVMGRTALRSYGTSYKIK